VFFIVGLGNINQSLIQTKHNFGFWVLDKFANEKSIVFKSSKGRFVFGKKHDICCVKPTTNMNNSGLAIIDLIKLFDLELEKMLIVYDDIDLDLGQIRFKKSGGSGGHKGIESILYHSGTDQFLRLRLGISVSGENLRPSEEYVLKPFRRKFDKQVSETIDNSIEAIKFLTEGKSIQEVMNRYN
tara:strand:+ start:394 stop:945 length:552 start_codon:yes stop_codon:yes gene_type:complete